MSAPAGPVDVAVVAEHPTRNRLLAVPAAFVLLNTLEDLVTPQIVGRSLALDPIVVFLGLMLCGWLWGPAGLLLAMPLLTCVRIIAERVPTWSPLAKLLSS